LTTIEADLIIIAVMRVDDGCLQTTALTSNSWRRPMYAWHPGRHPAVESEVHATGRAVAGAMFGLRPSIRLARPSLCAIVVAVAGCGDGLTARPLDAGTGDTPPAPIDASADAPGGVRDLIIHVESTGNDLNDGFARSVATLQRAVAIAAANRLVVGIEFAPGRYSAATGESFPYAVPDNLTITGPSSGAAVLVGSERVAGLVINKGTIRDLELEGFTSAQTHPLPAITATGEVHLTNVRIRTSTVAVSGTGSARVFADNLDVTGNAALCGTAIVLTGAADLVTTNLVTHTLASAVSIQDHATARIADASLQGEPACTSDAGPASVIDVATTEAVELRDSTLDSGEAGINVALLAATSPRVTLTNTTVRDMSYGLVGYPSKLEMTGGALTGNSTNAVFGLSGVWSFTNVAVKGNGFGISVVAPGLDSSTILTMRNCDISMNTDYGIEIAEFAAADLGTPASAGNNHIAGNFLGLFISGSVNRRIDAVGNHWNPGRQDANSAGDYPEAKTLTGPFGTELVKGDNFAISEGRTLQR
jgi:hypothetical protein